jgi:hypothetical protein
LHWTKMNNAARILTKFIVTITNHNRIIIHLWTTMRSSVTAKDVFPSVQAIIANASPMSHKRATSMRCSGFSETIARCRPKPKVEATWHTAA